MKEQLIQIRISDKQKSALEQKAESQGMNTSEAIRYLIQKWVEYERDRDMEGSKISSA